MLSNVIVKSTVWLERGGTYLVGEREAQLLDAVQRAGLREQWNRPVLWPLGLLALLVVAFTVPAIVVYRRRESGTARAMAPIPAAR